MRGVRSSGSGHALVEMRKDHGPGLVVAQAGLFVGESGVGEPENCAGVGRSEFDSDDSLGAFGGGGEPGQLDEAVALEAQEAPVMRMALSLKMRLEKEGAVDFGSHQDGAGRSKPAVELFGPREVERGGGYENSALTKQPKRPGGEIGWCDDRGHDAASVLRIDFLLQVESGLGKVRGTAEVTPVVFVSAEGEDVFA